MKLLLQKRGPLAVAFAAVSMFCSTLPASASTPRLSTANEISLFSALLGSRGCRICFRSPLGDRTRSYTVDGAVFN